MPITRSDPSAPTAATPDRGADRVTYLDVARALGVLGVILGHAWFGSRAERVTLTFDLALFFFISGFLYSDKYSERPDLLVWRRFKTLYLPFVGWGWGWLVLHNLLYALGVYGPEAVNLGTQGLEYDRQDFIHIALRIATFGGTEPMAGALWFLASLFVTNIIFGLLSWAALRITGRKGNETHLVSLGESVRAFLVLALATAGAYSNPILGNRRYLGTSLVALLIFYWGFLYRRYHTRFVLKWYIALAAAALVIWRGGGVYFGGNNYDTPILLVTLVPAGIYAALFVSQALQNNRLLQYIGTNTIFIIALHFIAFKLVSLIQIKVEGYPASYLAKFPVITGDHGWWIAYFLAGVFVPVGLKYAFDLAMACKRSEP